MSTAPRSFAFLRRGKWLWGHIIVVVSVLVFVNMGLWQLRRLGERQEFNELLTSRSAAEPRPLDEVLAEYGPVGADLELRTVQVVGAYRSADEVILLARSFNGLSGHHVLTPLALEDGRVLIVDRGWVPIDADQPDAVEIRPPQGQVEVMGVLRKTEVRGSFGPVDPAAGILDRIARVDLERLDQQIAGDVVGVYVQLLTQAPSQATRLPEIVDLPEPSDGPHLGYTVQWFLFAVVALVGYPILVLRTAESEGLKAESPAATPS